MSVVAWSPELRIEVKKLKRFSTNESTLHASHVLPSQEQKAVTGVFSTKEERKEPNYDYWA